MDNTIIFIREEIMSAIDLVLLGSLYHGKKSAYDLQRQVEARNLSRWVKIGSFTVYKKVIQYEKKGYVSSETVKNGNMPEKTLYSLTPEGKLHFKELMEAFASAETRVFLDFNAVIVNLALLGEDETTKYLLNIRKSIKNTKEQISESIHAHKDIPLFGRTILEQQYMLLETLEKWEAGFEEELKKQGKEGFELKKGGEEK